MPELILPRNVARKDKTRRGTRETQEGIEDTLPSDSASFVVTAGCL